MNMTSHPAWTESSPPSEPQQRGRGKRGGGREGEAGLPPRGVGGREPEPGGGGRSPPGGRGGGGACISAGKRGQPSSG